MPMSYTGRIKQLTSLAMLIAVAYIAVIISKQIPIKVAGFLTMDFSNVIVVIGGLIFGPAAAAIIAAIVAFIEMLTVSETGFYGFIMNVINTCSFACVAAAFYYRKREMKTAVVGLVAGCLSVTITMMLWNYIITPIYMGVPRAVVAGMLIPVFLPYNILKSGINAVLVIMLYKPVVVSLRSAGLAPANPGNAPGKINWAMMAAAGFLLISFTLLFLVLAGVLK